MYGNPDFDLYEAIYTTRSMRRLKPDPVPPALIVKIIEAATMGPSGGNRQPWKFVVVRDADTKAFVAERYKKAWDKYFTGKARALVENDPLSPQGRILRSARYLAEHMTEVPVMIFCCVRRYTDPGREGHPMLNALFPAVQNLCLAARGYGLGTSISGLHMRYGAEINARLGVPPEYENAALIPLGYPKGRWDRPVRKPALEATFWERWGESRDVEPES